MIMETDHGAVSKTAALKRFEQKPGASFRMNIPFAVSVGCLHEHGGYFNCIYNVIRKHLSYDKHTTLQSVRAVNIHYSSLS